jgi:hypothetical protein
MGVQHVVYQKETYTSEGTKNVKDKHLREPFKLTNEWITLYGSKP